MLQDRLQDWAAARGYGVAIAGAGVVETVRKRLEERKSAGMIDAGLYKEYLTGFRYLDGSTVAGPKCVVMVAVPSPIQVLRLTAGGREIDALIPPTYVRYNATFADVLSDMKENALGRDVEAETLKAPLKSLAVHMGLVVYGKNNITYVPGLGSGYQLCGYVVGAGEGAGEDRANAEGRETVLERCENCRACVKACPTGAIREDRFLISAERCFTLLSESRKPIPAWAKPPRSICLIGCMACQQVCPENKSRLKTRPSGVEFTAEETAAVLEAGRWLGTGEGRDEDAKASDRKAGLGEAQGGSAALASARAKFDRLGMSEDLEIMGRNLGYFLKRR
jgi:epoxyqueuosine reductase